MRRGMRWCRARRLPGLRVSPRVAREGPTTTAWERAGVLRERERCRKLLGHIRRGLLDGFSSLGGWSFTTLGAEAVIWDWCVRGSDQLPIVAMSEIFDGYERQYCELSANLSRKCTSVSGLHGEGETVRINVKNKPTSGTGMLSGATGSTTVISSTSRIKEAQAYRAQDWGR